MHILTTDGWEDYALLDSGEGYRLERFGDYVLSRPDPQAIWSRKLDIGAWSQAAAEFSDKWKLRNPMPEKWQMQYKDLKFWAKLSPFKHTGVFGEQIVQWDWLWEKARGRVLNLFGYTGIATLVCAKAGAEVTHVDASKPSIAWARENLELSGLSKKPVRWIMEDVVKFCKREVRRGATYDGIIMDPPVFGHGPSGEVWKFNESFPVLLELCKKLLSPTPAFLLINAYAVSASAIMLNNVLEDLTKGLKGKIEYGELVLVESVGRRMLSTGIYGRWYLPTPNFSG